MRYRTSKSRTSSGSTFGFTRFPKIINGKPSSVTFQVIWPCVPLRYTISTHEVYDRYPERTRHQWGVQPVLVRRTISTSKVIQPGPLYTHRYWSYASRILSTLTGTASLPYSTLYTHRYWSTPHGYCNHSRDLCTLTSTLYTHGYFVHSRVLIVHLMGADRSPHEYLVHSRALQAFLTGTLYTHGYNWSYTSQVLSYTSQVLIVHLTGTDQRLMGIAITHGIFVHSRVLCILLLVKMCEKTRQQKQTFFCLEQILVVPIAYGWTSTGKLEASNFF